MISSVTITETTRNSFGQNWQMTKSFLDWGGMGIVEIKLKWETRCHMYIADRHLVCTEKNDNITHCTLSDCFKFQIEGESHREKW